MRRGAERAVRRDERTRLGGEALPQLGVLALRLGALGFHGEELVRQSRCLARGRRGRGAVDIQQRLGGRLPREALPGPADGAYVRLDRLAPGEQVVHRFALALGSHGTIVPSSFGRISASAVWEANRHGRLWSAASKGIRPNPS